MSQKETNVFWYVLFAFILVLFISCIQVYTTSMLDNPQISVSDSDEEYILQINNIDIEEYQVSRAEIEKDVANPDDNNTGSQAKDFALEFFYARSLASQLGSLIKNVFFFPEFIAILLKIPLGSISWIVTPLNWFWTATMLGAVYFFIRGVVT